MTDILERLRSLRYVHVPVASQLMDEAAAEIERLRLELSVQKACTVAGREEIARLRLTAEEREAVRFFADIHGDDDPPHEYADTLRSLLTRLHT
jgi:hypothetical protein